MKILLTTLNSKYSHISLALRYLRSVLKQIDYHETTLKEFTINQNEDDILSQIEAGDYDIVCFSTYIWNVEMICRIAESLKKIRPQIKVILGGPEVSYNVIRILEKNMFVDGIIFGEGEQTIADIFENPTLALEHLTQKGTAWRREEKIVFNGQRPLIQVLDDIPFPYSDEDCFDNRLVYYESSRGCPYNCKYCLSSTLEGIRFFSIERVCKDIEWLLEKNIRTIKFVDRTFNANHHHAIEILRFIKAHDNGTTCFHFEINAGSLKKEFIEFCQTLRPGLVQFEIGVQSTCPEALKAVGRPDWTVAVTENVKQLQTNSNIHLHLDLIAGLPYEGYKRFLESFDAVYTMKPDMLQLGFLKLIPGTELREKYSEFDYQWRNAPPYEVLSSQWIKYRELNRLKKIETLLDRFYQEGKLKNTLNLLEQYFETPSQMYLSLINWWEENVGFENSVGVEDGWVYLYDFGCTINIEKELLREAMRIDSVVHMRPKGFQGTALESKELGKGDIHTLLHQKDFYQEGLVNYLGISPKQLLKELHFEIFEWDLYCKCRVEPRVLIFNVRKPVFKQASFLLKEINDRILKEKQ